MILLPNIPAHFLRSAPANANSVGYRFGVFVLPYMHRFPPKGQQGGVNPAVPIDIGRQFAGPPFGVGPRRHIMNWAGMPETAIDEDGQPGSNHDDVGSPRQFPIMQPEPDSSSMQCRSQRHLRLGVSDALQGHAPAHRVRRCSGTIPRIIHRKDH